MVNGGSSPLAFGFSATVGEEEGVDNAPARLVANRS